MPGEGRDSEIPVVPTAQTEEERIRVAQKALRERAATTATPQKPGPRTADYIGSITGGYTETKKPEPKRIPA